MTIAFGNDHAAREVRRELLDYLKGLGHTVVDFGYEGDGPADYPVYARKVANAVVKGEADCGILVCGTGIGMSIAANKVHGVRCAVCSDTYSAAKAREHNNANVIAVGARVVGVELLKDIFSAYLGAQYNPKYDPRIAMIADIERVGE